jgi:hypothetical protein
LRRVDGCVHYGCVGSSLLPRRPRTGEPPDCETKESLL